MTQPRSWSLLLIAAAASLGLPVPHAQGWMGESLPGPGPVTAPAQSVKEAVEHANAAVARIVAIPDDQRTFENTLGAIDDLTANLETETSLLIFMSNVSPDEKLRIASQQAEEEVGNYAIELGKREDLHKAVMAYSKANPKLEGEQKRFLEFTLRDYKRAGMVLSKEDREKVTA